MPLKLENVCTLLQVFDMPRSIAFYRDVLGFQVVSSAPSGDDWDWVLLRLDTIELMLNTRYERPNRPARPIATQVKAHGDTCLYFGCRDIDAAYGYLHAKGFAVKPPVVRDYGMKQLYLKDPDGFEICLQWRVD